jgi:hypothetical protein
MWTLCEELPEVEKPSPIESEVQQGSHCHDSGAVTGPGIIRGMPDIWE